MSALHQIKKIAVFFGGPSFEHDISVLTGLQVISAMDYTRFMPIPVYVDLQGYCWTGDALLFRKNYYPSRKIKSKLTRLELPFGRPTLEPELQTLSKFGWRSQEISFDCALLAFHGTMGEDGAIQGLLEAMQIPYTGCRVLESALFMNKALTKRWCRGVGIPVLPDVCVRQSSFKGKQDLEAAVKTLGARFPLCVKPCHLGSSLGVKRVDSLEALEEAVLSIFRMDAEVLIEPFVEPLEEYNIAVTRVFGDVRVSAIEKPIRQGAILDFKDKYLAEGGQDSKLGISNLQGMASASREICPKGLKPEMADAIRKMAKDLFESLQATGSPRIDFLSHAETGEIWLNEVNPLPGSLAYYLWEQADTKVRFGELIDVTIAEAFREFEKRRKVVDPRLVSANLFSSKD